MSKEILEKFDAFVKAEGLDSFSVIYALLKRAYDRVWRLDRIFYLKRGEDIENVYSEILKVNCDGVNYVQFDGDCVCFSDYLEHDPYQGGARFGDDYEIEYKDAFSSKEPDYRSAFETRLKEIEQEEKKIREVRTNQQKQEIQQLFYQLSKLNLSDQEILKRVKDQKNSDKIVVHRQDD